MANTTDNMADNMTVREKTKRQELREKKPLAYAKIIKHPEKIKNKECVALVQLQYNYLCNFKCKHCAIERFKQQKGRTLTVADVKRIADQADAMGLASICLSGGEPLIFPDLKEILLAIGPERFVISMDTNAWFLTEEKTKWLVDMGVDRVHLSLDGLEFNHDDFRKAKGAWKRVIQALEYCKKYGLGVNINLVATKSMVLSGELIKELDFLAQFEVHTSIIHAKPIGAFEQYKDEILDTKDMNYIQTLHQQLGGKYNSSTHLSPNCGYEFGCLAVKREFSITAHGDVMPCPWIPISLGNIFNEDLDAIIKRGLGMKWFSYDHKFSCLSGNKDMWFYKNIMPQTEKTETYPIDYKKINWEA